VAAHFKWIPQYDKYICTFKVRRKYWNKYHDLRWLERVLVFFDALYLGVKIFRLELANHDQILPQNNDNIKVSIFCRFLTKFVAMATQLGFEV